ncbi:hypothetical protein MSAN_02311800 [Mycena sanguinolenta]|uniref:Uncharacterized protein n=1 Tax=Mycena sanguinolenta TaxID=230812 RepID=A0A8H7CGZ1_9AGAR|nr:hypothetical protein MSAN_02311800 [Mycena sanguinolenta]
MCLFPKTSGTAVTREDRARQNPVYMANFHQIPTRLMANITELPNPFSPLAFLPPDLANQFEVSRYVFAATLGAYVWDIGLNLGNDYDLLSKHRVRFPTIVYFFSRASTLAYILACFIYEVAPVENCSALVLGLGILIVLTQTSTAMLFFLRVTAVWHDSKIAYAVFSILWMAVLGAGITVPLGVRAAHIGPTLQCIDTIVPANIEVSVIVPLINDTAVFLAINYRILVHMIVTDSSMARLRGFFGGTGLSALSRALLQSGQHFYLIATTAHLTLLVVMKLPQLSPVYHAMLSIPVLALVNAMACLVFRRIKFGLISSDGTSKIPSINLPSDFHATANPKSLPLYFRHTDPTTSDPERTTTFSLEAYVWDIGLNLGNDYDLLFKHSVCFPTIVASTFAFILTSFIFTVAPVENCNALTLGITICIILTQISTAMLFFLRVTAVWHPNKIAYVVFSILWLGVLGAGISDPFGMRAAHIGPTKQCIDTVVPASTEVMAIMPLINDTAIFLAINYRILAHTIVPGSPMARLRVLFGGTGLSALSRALIESGQHFYLVAVATHITFLVVLKLPQLGPVYHGMLAVPGLALVNGMACLVFRKIKFGLISSDGVSKIPTIWFSSDVHATANPKSLPLHYRRTDPTTTDLESITTFPLEVRVQRETCEFEDGADAGKEMFKSINLA